AQQQALQQQQQRDVAQERQQNNEDVNQDVNQELVHALRDMENGDPQRLIERIYDTLQGDHQLAEEDNGNALGEHDQHSDSDEDDSDFVPVDSDLESDNSDEPEEIEQFERFLNHDEFQRDDDDEQLDDDHSDDGHSDAAEDDELPRLFDRVVRGAAQVPDPPLERPNRIPEREEIPQFEDLLQERLGAVDPGLRVEQDNIDNEAFFFTLPIPLVILAADLFIVIYLLSVYFVPTLVGTSLVHLVFFLASLLKGSVYKTVGKFVPLPDDESVMNLVKLAKDHSPSLLSIALKNTVQPVWRGLLAIHNQDKPLTKFERILILCVFFLTFVSAIHMTLSRPKARFRATGKPIVGIERKTYVILFGLLSTIKVFSIFAIELFLFPTFCGGLLIFVLSPIFLDETKWNLLSFSFTD
ncbi:uncharacterized protein CYBJADRAFT_172215, partial [Cyberlindnera jadinii NRRL Y-1542]